MGTLLYVHQPCLFLVHVLSTPVGFCWGRRERGTARVTQGRESGVTEQRPDRRIQSLGRGHSMTDPDVTDDIMVATTVDEVRTYLGMVNFNRRPPPE